MDPVLHFLRRRAEDVAVALMVAMFAAFIIQIGSRYIFNAPTDWTHEVILITWLWTILWGAAFLLDDKDQVKFDVIYSQCREPVRRRLALVAAIVLGGGFLASLPATYDFVTFKRIRSSDILGLRLDIVFSVYLIFLVAVIAHYAWRAWH